jgi:hypothetical protein
MTDAKELSQWLEDAEDIGSIEEVAKRAIKQLEITQNALDDFMSAAATETIKTLQAQTKLAKVQRNIRGLVQANGDIDGGLPQQYIVDFLTEMMEDFE